MRSQRTIWLIIAILVFVLPVLFSALPNLVTDWLWFDSVGFSSVFRTRLLARWGFTILGVLISLIWMGGNLLLAVRMTGRFPRVQRLAEKQLKIDWRSQSVALAWMGVVLVALVAGLAVGGQWETVLLFFNQTAFGSTDPVFGQDIGFYFFSWPFLQLLANWGLWLVGLSLVGSLFVHAGDQIQAGRIHLDPAGLIHLTILAAVFLGLRAWDYYLQRYDVLYSVHGALQGAGYTDIHVRLPAYNALAIILGAAAVLILVNIYLRKVWLVWVPLVAWLVASFIMLDVAPSLVQRLVVTPDELSRERPYIERSIEFTRQAYGLDAIEAVPFGGNQELTMDDLQRNTETLANIRLWDWQPLQRTYRQLQEIRTYYEFGDVDVERYDLLDGPRSVMLSPREMRTDQLTDQAKTWLNQHLIYTHGYGVVLNAVSEVTSEGLPNLLVRDIPPQTDEPSLEIQRPEIYFGESEANYVIVGTMEDELDYPQGDTNKYTRYEGTAGVQLKNVWRRSMFSARYGDLPILISRSINGDSRILMHRPVRERILTVAPFLWLDEDPYMVIVDGRLFWIQDAYTYSDRYPYSAPVEWPGRDVNYLRNSVKIVVDAYNGDMTFYVADSEDPVVQTFAGVYPGLFTSYDEMPAGLKSHVRYPEDLFTIQAQMYMTYHMRDPQVFYNREDLWQPAIEVRGSAEAVVDPYFVFMRLPGQEQSEFMLMLPLTPTGKDNLIAWLYADSDGEDYGEMGVLQFSKQELVYGPRQIEARIDQDPLISQQLSLWNQRGSQVIRGNTMVIPVEGGLVYVEPIFLQAENGRMPELKRIIVAHGSQIAMQETFAGALAQVFGEAGAVVQQDGTTGEEGTLPLPEDVANLARVAEEHYQAAQDCLTAGDWTCYGQEQQALRDALEALVALTQPAE